MHTERRSPRVLKWRITCRRPVIVDVITLSRIHMTVSSRTPEGQPNHCPLCDRKITIEPSQPFGDAPCPSCGQLLWFTRRRDGLMFYDSTTAEIKKSRIREFIAQQLGVRLENIPEDIHKLDVSRLGGDSLDVVELVMELEEEFDIYTE